MKTLFLNPFERFSEKLLITSGVGFLVLGSYMSTLSHANFDGTFDLHFSEKTISFAESFFQNGVDVLVLFILLWLAGILINKKTRAVDILSAVLISRILLYFMALFNLNKTFSISETATVQEVSNFAQENIFILAIFGITVLVSVVWMVALLYNGYKVATNAKGTKPIVFFIAAIVFSEIISKLIIYTFSFNL